MHREGLEGVEANCGTFDELGLLRVLILLTIYF